MLPKIKVPSDNGSENAAKSTNTGERLGLSLSIYIYIIQTLNIYGKWRVYCFGNSLTIYSVNFSGDMNTTTRVIPDFGKLKQNMYDIITK